MHAHRVRLRRSIAAVRATKSLCSCFSHEVELLSPPASCVLLPSSSRLPSPLSLRPLRRGIAPGGIFKGEDQITGAIVPCAQGSPSPLKPSLEAVSELVDRHLVRAPCGGAVGHFSGRHSSDALATSRSTTMAACMATSWHGAPCSLRSFQSERPPNTRWRSMSRTAFLIGGGPRGSTMQRAAAFGYGADLC